MTELQNIETDIKSMEQKIENWFHVYFISSEAGTQSHAAINKAHEELKAIVGIAQTKSVATETPSTPAISPAS